MTFRTLLVPTDFSTGAEHSLRRALMLPRHEPAVMHLVHVLAPPSRRHARLSALAVARRGLDAFVQRAERLARAAEPPVMFASKVLEGRPFVEIVRYARSTGIELVVLGRHGERPVRDLFIGSTAERVVRSGQVPVLVVNEQPRGPYRRPLIAAALDQSSRWVVDVALNLLEPDVGTVRVVHAAEALAEGFFAPGDARKRAELARSLQAEAKDRLGALLRSYGQRGLEWKVSIRSADARTYVAAEAVRTSADLLALGTHSRSGLAHAIVGSVAEWLVRSAPCDVVVTRPKRFSFSLP